MERRHQLGLDSYDRLFPNQDTMPKGGFGNLIALPLQFTPRRSGHSVFVDAELRPYPDQWEFLSSIRRLCTVTNYSWVDAGQLWLFGVAGALTDCPNRFSRAENALVIRSGVTESGRGMVNAGRFVRGSLVNRVGNT